MIFICSGNYVRIYWHETAAELLQLKCWTCLDHPARMCCVMTTSKWLLVGERLCSERLNKHVYQVFADACRVLYHHQVHAEFGMLVVGTCITEHERANILVCAC